MSKLLFRGFMLSVLALMGNGVYSQEIPDSCQLTAETFYIRIHQDVERVIIDTRATSEDRHQVIPGAVMAPKPAVLSAILDTLPVYRSVYLYCNYGDRSKQALKYTQKSYPNHRVYNLKRGLDRWKELNFPLDTLGTR